MKLYFLVLGLMFYSTWFAQNIIISTGNFFEGEPSLAIDPTNNQHLVAAWMGFQFNQKIVIKSSVSWNGGTSWTAPIFQSHEVLGNSSADVSLGFDPQGNAFMCYIDYDNVGFTQGKVVVRKSTDGGLTWGSSVEVININDCPGQLCIDRPWMVIDPSGISGVAPIYVTSMNADQPAMITPPYHPYLSVSVDGGQSFQTPRVLDTLNFLAGSSIPQPMPTPTVDGNGRFYAMYPSYLTSQSIYPRQILAYSDNHGLTMQHQLAYQGLNIGISNSQCKRAAKLIADETHPGHLAFCFLSEQNDQSDVYFMETTDGGQNWSAMQKVNQDPIGNNRVQDLVWGDFNANGDLVLTWRDRRNAPADGYAQASEIFAATKPFGTSTFTTDYAISSQAAAHDTILEGSGNDFMSVAYIGDTCYAIWGDVRSGTLKIYLNKWHDGTQQNSLNLIAEEHALLAYPNPAANELFLTPAFLNPCRIRIVNELGQEVLNEQRQSIDRIDVSMYIGTFQVEIYTEGKSYRCAFSRHE